MYFIYDPFTENHLFLVNNLKYNLELFNYKVEIIQSINENIDNINYYVIIINHMFLIENEKAKIDYKNVLNKKNKILYITEPLELMIEINLYNKMIKYLKPQKILTYCEENLKKIKTFIPYINFYPINKKYLTFINVNLELLKKKDLTKIVFIGKMNEYRNQLKDIFKEDLVIIEDKFSKEEWIEIIKKYQYFVNVHRRPNSKCFESLRLIPLLYNQCAIISEHVNKKEEEYFKNENIYFCELSEMKNKFEEIKKVSINKIVNKVYNKNINMEKFFIV
jgi:hypothetical protein